MAADERGGDVLGAQPLHQRGRECAVLLVELRRRGEALQQPLAVPDANGFGGGRFGPFGLDARAA